MLHTLKGKMSTIYIGLVLLIALVGSISLTDLFSLEKSVNALMTRNYRSISSASDMLDCLNYQDKAVITYLSLDEKTGLDKFYDNQTTFQKDFEIDAHNVTEKGERSIIDRISKDYGSFGKMFSTLIQIKNEQGKAAAKDYYDATMEPVISDMQKQIHSLIIVNQTAMFRSKSEASESARLSMYVVLAITLLAVMGGFFVSRYYVNLFLKPIHQLTEEISKVRAGQLDLRLDINSSDETGKLANEFNEMTKRLSVFEKSTMGTVVNERNKSVAIVKSISDPLIVLDNTFRIILLNRASEKFFSIKEEHAINRHFLEVIHNGELFDFISSNPEGSKSRLEKIIQFGHDGNCYYNVVVTRIYDPYNRISGYILLMQNVTKLKELERVKTSFMETVSHELKTPLTSILMGASMLEEAGTLNDEQHEFLSTIMEDGDRLSKFINELLEISKMEAGKSIFRFALCSPNAIIENSMRQFQELALKQNVALQSDLADDLPDIEADFEKITWVINNLLSNALKYSKAGDTVKVTDCLRGEKIEITVSDSGEGIPPEYLDRIFERFVQVEGRDIEVRGTGLGLSVAKEFISAHGGDIRVESKLGCGSTFFITLPLRQPGKEGAE